MYYVFERFGARHPCRWITHYPVIEGLWWDDGARFTEPIPNPLEITMDPYDPDAEDQSSEMPEYFKGEIPLFRDDLVEAMRRIGVDNLDLYQAVVIDPDSGKRHTNYKAINIIGTIAAADMEASDATVQPGGPVIDVDFDSLVVDERKALGALIFRLAESTNAILVHERLKDQLLAEGFTALEFLDPREVAL